MTPPPTPDSENEKLNIQFATLHRLATNPNHHHVYEWGDERDGTIDVLLCETDPVTGEFVDLLALLNQFNKCDPHELLDLVENATEEALAQVDAYFDEIQDKLERDTPLLKKLIAKRAALRPFSELDPIAEEEEEDEAESDTSSSESTPQTMSTFGEEEADHSDVDAGSSLLTTNLGQHEERQFKFRVNTPETISAFSEEEADHSDVDAESPLLITKLGQHQERQLKLRVNTLRLKAILRRFTSIRGFFRKRRKKRLGVVWLRLLANRWKKLRYPRLE